MSSALCWHPPQLRCRSATPRGSIRCHHRRVAIARDDHATRCLRSACSLPSCAGRGQCCTDALIANEGALRSHQISTPRAICALQAPFPEGKGTRQHRLLPPACHDRARRAASSTPHAVRDLQAFSPAELADDSAARQHRLLPLARRDRTRQARRVPSALCTRSPQPSWRMTAQHGSIGCCRWRVAIARDEHTTCRPRSAAALPTVPS
jgi:hypothetical protein